MEYGTAVCHLQFQRNLTIFPVPFLSLEVESKAMKGLTFYCFLWKQDLLENFVFFPPPPNKKNNKNNKAHSYFSSHLPPSYRYSYRLSCMGTWKQSSSSLAMSSIRPRWSGSKSWEKQKRAQNKRISLGKNKNERRSKICVQYIRI